MERKASLVSGMNQIAKRKFQRITLLPSGEGEMNQAIEPTNSDILLAQETQTWNDASGNGTTCLWRRSESQGLLCNEYRLVSLSHPFGLEVAGCFGVFCVCFGGLFGLLCCWFLRLLPLVPLESRIANYGYFTQDCHNLRDACSTARSKKIKVAVVFSSISTSMKSPYHSPLSSFFDSHWL